MVRHDISAALGAVGQTAAASRDPDRWSDVARLAARALDAGRATIGFLNRRGTMLERACPDTDPDWHERYDAEMHAANHIWAQAAGQPAGRALTATDHKARRGYRRSTIFNDFIRPQGFDALMTLTLTNPRSGTIGLLTVGRRQGRDPFDSDDIRFGAELATALARMLDASQPVFLADEPATDLPREALVTPEGRVLRHEAWLAEWSRAGVIVLRQGTLSMPLLPGLAAALRATGRASDDWPPPVGIVIGPVATSLGRINVALLPGGRSAPGAVRLRISRASEAEPRTRLARAFGLTPRECDIACLLASGCSLPEAAERLEISLTTARTHLSRLFDKTDTRTQLQLGLLAHDWLATRT
ncbi:helix-turn-helix transcriptional regulator [Paracoccus marinaquae]|uniref:LuxR C-terminal-related transcriptional regulator n=1 Tax=Paracoccus marinaquae TaxID=2841926 RepID=A0ABS6AIG8_9RHOB|nr:LuxR C-terminal-related transcriptional regulator [Paracoccus marinaquae]MBU3030304.1 LuxR C-terminal-related transcriptional regulator [Paracoccus marinaquae]